MCQLDYKKIWEDEENINTNSCVTVDDVIIIVIRPTHR